MSLRECVMTSSQKALEVNKKLAQNNCNPRVCQGMCGD
jgi:hypothetical protein